jgi:Fungal specific transcription factor domain
MFDRQHFQTRVPVPAQSSVPLVYAMLAISARQMERQKKLNGDQDSLQFYQESIRSLTPHLLASDPNIMATCVILCVLEMMSASLRNWRKHLEMRRTVEGEPGHSKGLLCVSDVGAHK